MLTMDQIHHIREMYYGQGYKISEIARKEKLDRRTVAKYIDKEDFNRPAPKPASEYAFCPKLDPFKPVIDRWLTDDKKAPRKQRHTAKRVYRRLCKEVPDFNCSYRLVAEYVAAKKKDLNLCRSKGAIPLVHYPGEGQADFGSASFYENGYKWDGKYFVLTFPYSNVGYPQLHYGENMECLLESMDAVFRHIGGVPTEIWFDNTTTIVTKIIRGGGRELTDTFQRFTEHYGFKPVFCNPDSGNEKGNVENKVGYSRRNFMVPVPRFLNLKDYNCQLLKEFDEDTDRDHYKKNDLICNLFEKDRAALLPLPRIPFDMTGHRTCVTDNYGKCTIDGKYTYSTSPEYACQTVNLSLTSSTVTIYDLDYHEIVRHKRLYGDKKAESIDWLLYLKYIARKPRSLRNSGIYDQLPINMQKYLDQCSNQDRGRMLRVLAELTERTGFDSALQTIDQAVLYNAVDPDSLESLYRRLYTDVPELPPLQTGNSIPKVIPIDPNLWAYDGLLKGGVIND